MNPVQLATWRDAALILLVAQAIVLVLLPGVVFYYGVQGVRKLHRWIRPVLFEARLRVWQVHQGADRAVRAVAAPFVWVHSAAAGLQRALETLGWR